MSIGALAVTEQLFVPRVPRRAMVISILALEVPLAATVWEVGGPQVEALIWLAALVPGFLLAYHRGWRGATTALGLGMAALTFAQVLLNATGRSLASWPLLWTGLAGYIFISLGIGWLAERIHRDRLAAQRLAYADPLTGLANRRSAQLFLEQQFAAAQRGRAFSVVVFDLDGFKQYNDRYGHAAGDEALCTFASVLEETTRASSLSARWGGEEFVALLPDCDLAGAVVFAERVRHALGGRVPAAGPITVSAGLATYAPGQVTGSDLVAAADRALYWAKASGRDCVRVHGMPLQAVSA